MDRQNPSLSWELVSEKRSVLQTAYQVLVSDDSELLRADKGNVWNSGRLISGQSIQVIYAGKPLMPMQKYFWKVRVWDNHGNESGWSTVASWRMGLLSIADWGGAQWIGYSDMPDSQRIIPAYPGPLDKNWGYRQDTLPLLRKDFTVNKPIRSAMLYISGLGQFEISLNGKKVGDHFLDPGWTKYDKEALYVGFDLTGQVRQGQNAMGVMLGNGFYYVPSERYVKITTAFGYPKMICRLMLSYQDGSSDAIVSDTSWKTTPGPVTFSSVYGGEDYDATLEKPGWNLPGSSADGWRTVIISTGPPNLNAQMMEPVKVFEHFRSAKVTHPKAGVWVYDLGQNSSGIPRIAVTGKKGAVVKITPAELLSDDGLVMQDAIGKPVYFRYTLKGNGLEDWQPRFMYFGFRYLQVEGAVPTKENNPDHLPVIASMEGLHTRNAAARVGAFTCSDELFNKTWSLINRAIESNMSSIFTDCPHREKLGWLEEVHLMGSSIRYNYDIASLCRKVVRDMIQAQTPEGLIPDIAPEYVQFGDGFRDSPEWGSSAILLPWYLYKWYGDRQVLGESYSMMTRYTAYLAGKSKGHILYFGLGDWYDIGPEPPGVSQLTPEGITGTAMYYYDLTVLCKTAGLLGKTEDSVKYSILGDSVRAAFNRTFFHAETEEYGTGSQTANAMAVYMGLVQPRDKDSVIANIIRDIRSRHNSLTAGDIGYRYLLQVLDDAGRSDVIYDMNSDPGVPGYGYQLAHGATALTESWQAFRDCSNDHMMLGHLMEWFYNGLGGIRPGADSVAFRQIIIRPEAPGKIMAARATYHSPYGMIITEWKKDAAGFVLKVTLPVNTTGTIELPAKPGAKIMEGDSPLAENRNIHWLGLMNGRAVFTVGSGVYTFRAVVVKDIPGLEDPKK